MYPIVPGSLLLLIIILLSIYARLNKSSVFKKEDRSRNIASLCIRIVSVFLFIVFIFSFKKGASELILDSLHIMIIENNLTATDYNFYSEHYDDEVIVFKYPVYDYSTTALGHLFKVVNNNKFDSYLTSLSSFNGKYVQEDFTIYTLNINEATFYLVYLEFNNHYRLLSATTFFRNMDTDNIVMDYIPIIPCSYFSNYDIGYIDTDSASFQTHYSWDETKSFYESLETDLITVDEVEKTIFISNSMTNNEYHLIYSNDLITLERLNSTD